MKKYDHIKIEPKWQKKWESNHIYQAKNISKQKKFYGLIEFPYPSGAGLHVGHIRSNTAMDIITRKRRMEGYNVLYPIGWDAFGLPTENYAIKTGKQPKLITKQNTDTFRKQLKALGFGFDWSREVNTTDPAYYKWTQWIFLQFFKHGLAYKKKTEINWCPKDKIGLANEEVVGGVCERCGSPVEKREKDQWMLAITKYADRLDRDLDTVDYLEKIKIQQRNWIGKSEGAEIDFKLKIENSKDKNIPSQVLIGTRNEAKFRMVKECLPKIPGVEFVSLNDIPSVDDSKLVEGADFEENARMKAEFYFKKTGLPTISTDNILWIEKWPKDNGVMIHMRKEANPKSDRASDEEVVEFLKKWVKKVGGKSLAHFEYALAFANASGVQSFVSRQRDYVLQTKQSQNFCPGYPTESLLIDAKTKEYKGDQDNSVRYSALIADLKIHATEWLVSPEAIKVFTTRADTLFGATYLVLAPEHSIITNLKSRITNWEEVEKYIQSTKKKTEIERTNDEKDKTGVELKGIKAINPGNGEEVPIWVADYVLPHYGTGAIMAVPAHDERDFAFAKKYNLPIRSVIEPLFTETPDPALPFVEREAISAIIKHWKDDLYLGLKWKKADWGTFVTGGVEKDQTPEEAARREILEETGFAHLKLIEVLPRSHSKFYHIPKKENRFAHFHNFYFQLENNEQLELSEDEKNKHEIVWLAPREVEKFLTPEGQRKDFLSINSPRSFYSGEGIIGNSGKFNGLDSGDARKKIAESVGGKIVTKYKLRDWIFSRQRYWGEPIPLIFCAKDGWVPVPEKDLPVKLPEVKSYQPTDTGESPLAAIKKWVNVKCPICKGQAKRETDTMPNWAGSSWYYLRYVDPKNKKEFASKKALDYFAPVDWYNGGMEHTTLHLLYSRFWHKFLYDIKLVPTTEPYAKRTSHGLILADDGSKISKSKGNGIDPMDVVKMFGADTLRLYEMFMGPFDQPVSWNAEALIGPRRFLERVWRVSVKVESGKSKVENQAFQTMLHKTVKKVGEDIETMSFNTAISALMILLNEMEKVEAISLNNWKMFLRLLAPFAPHITEELWMMAGEKKSIHVSSWPSFDPSLLESDTIKIIVQVNSKNRGEILANKNASEEEVRDLVLALPAINTHLAGKSIKRFIYVPGKLVNLVVA